jgi:Rrf2 family protein
MFSRSCQYALQSVLYIHLKSGDGNAVKSRDIARSQQIPLLFLGKILQTLVKHDILESVKGPQGGFVLKEGREQMTLLGIVQNIDGLQIFDHCGIGLKICSDANPCPIHHEYKTVRERIHELFSRKTIAALCADVEEGTSIVNLNAL